MGCVRRGKARMGTACSVCLVNSLPERNKACDVTDQSLGWVTQLPVAGSVHPLSPPVRVVKKQQAGELLLVMTSSGTHTGDTRGGGGGGVDQWCGTETQGRGVHYAMRSQESGAMVTASSGETRRRKGEYWQSSYSQIHRGGRGGGMGQAYNSDNKGIVCVWHVCYIDCLLTDEAELPDEEAERGGSMWCQIVFHFINTKWHSSVSTHILQHFFLCLDPFFFFYWCCCDIYFLFCWIGEIDLWYNTSALPNPDPPTYCFSSTINVWFIYCSIAQD